MKATEKESTVWNPLLHFLDKHYVAFSIVVGLLISFLIRRRTRPKRKDDEGNGPSLDDLLRQGTDPLECGGETDTYRWTQGEDEIDVYVSVDRLRGDDGNGGRRVAKWQRWPSDAGREGDPILEPDASIPELKRRAHVGCDEVDATDLARERVQLHIHVKGRQSAARRLLLARWWIRK